MIELIKYVVNRFAEKPEELQAAMTVLTVCVRIAVLEKLLEK